jgi:hypothetical protein
VTALILFVLLLLLVGTRTGRKCILALLIVAGFVYVVSHDDVAPKPRDQVTTTAPAPPAATEPRQPVPHRPYVQR